jgi:hypothetical protein
MKKSSINKELESELKYKQGPVQWNREVQTIRAKIKINGYGKVFVGKKDVSKYVKSIAIWVKAGEVPQCRVEMLGQVDFEGPCEVNK